MNATERVINDLNVSICMLCNPEMLTPEMCISIGQAINSAINLLIEQENEFNQRIHIADSADRR